MYYVLDDKGNKIEAYSKEEIMAVLQQAIEDGSLSGIDAQSAFVSKLKCCVDGGTFKQAFVTEAKYNELKANNQLEEDTIYHITDDNTLNSLLEVIESHSKEIEEINEVLGKKRLIWSKASGSDSTLITDVVLEDNKFYQFEYYIEILSGSGNYRVFRSYEQSNPILVRDNVLRFHRPLTFVDSSITSGNYTSMFFGSFNINYSNKELNLGIVSETLKIAPTEVTNYGEHLYTKEIKLYKIYEITQ